MTTVCRICGSAASEQNIAASVCSTCGARTDAEDGGHAFSHVPGFSGFYALVGGIVAFAISWFVGYWVVRGMNGADLIGGLKRSGGEWVEFQHPNDYFRASFPAAPSHTTHTIFTAAGPITGHYYQTMSLLAGKEFGVSYFEIPKHARFDKQGAMDGAVEYGTRQLKRFVTTRLDFAGHPAMEIKGDGHNGKEHVTYVFRAGPRWYTIAAVGGDPGDRARFLASIRIQPSHGSRHGIDWNAELPQADATISATWKTCESSAGGFRCELPETPTLHNGWEDHSSCRALVAQDNDGGGRFTVYYRDLSTHEAADPIAALERALAAIPLPASQTKAQEISVDGFAGRHIQSRGADSRVSAARLVIAEGRLYGLLTDAVAEDRADRFFSSFRILAPEKHTAPAAAAAVDSSAPVQPVESANATRPPRDEAVDLYHPLVQGLTSFDRQEVEQAFSRLHRQQPDPARREVVLALQYVMLKSANRAHRQQAAEALGKWGNEGSVPSLISALDDEWPFVTRAAIKGLGRLATPQALQALAAKFPESKFRHDAKQALVQAGPASVPYLGQLLRSSHDDFVRADACDALARIGSWDARSYLSSAQNDSSGLVRMRAKSALKNLDGNR